jgi:hypothetical protein
MIEKNQGSFEVSMQFKNMQNLPTSCLERMTNYNVKYDVLNTKQQMGKKRGMGKMSPS